MTETYTFDILWTVPGTELKVPTHCENLDDFMVYVRAHCDGKIEIVSVNGVPIVNAGAVEVVKEGANEDHAD